MYWLFFAKIYFNTNQLLEVCNESMKTISLDGRTLVMKYDFIVYIINCHQMEWKLNMDC